MDCFASLKSPFESEASPVQVSGEDVWRGIPPFPFVVTRSAVKEFQDWFNTNSSRIVLLTGVWPQYESGVPWAPSQGPLFPSLLLSTAGSFYPSMAADLWVSWMLK